MSATIIVDLIMGFILLYGLWLFHQIIRKTILVYAAKEKYIALYDLKKLEIELKERNLSFEDLDSFGTKFIQSDKKSRVREIDDEYESHERVETKKK